MENNNKTGRKDEGRVFAGLILVCVGAALLLRNTGFPMPYWLFSWPMLLIAIGLYSGFKSNFKNNGWIVMLAIGGFFLADRIIPGLSIAPYFWPVLIIGVGVLFILRPKKDPWSCDNEKKNNTDMNTINYQQSTTDSSFTADRNFTADRSDELNVKSIFSGINRNVVSKNFQGGKLTCVFGGADIDLTQADIHEKTILRFEVVFGGVKLVVPSHWTVYNEIDGVFHGVDDKRKFNAAAGTAPEKILILRGSVVFGGVEIRSY